MAAFLSRVDLSRYGGLFEFETILADRDAITTGNTSAKVAVDIALHNVVGRLMKQPRYDIWRDRERQP